MIGWIESARNTASLPDSGDATERKETRMEEGQFGQRGRRRQRPHRSEQRPSVGGNAAQTARQGRHQQSGRIAAFVQLIRRRRRGRIGHPELGGGGGGGGCRWKRLARSFRSQFTGRRRRQCRGSQLSQQPWTDAHDAGAAAHGSQSSSFQVNSHRCIFPILVPEAFSRLGPDSNITISHWFI